MLHLGYPQACCQLEGKLQFRLSGKKLHGSFALIRIRGFGDKASWLPGHSGGESETIIGRWMKARGNRERVIIATKVRSRMRTGPNAQGLSQRYIMQEVEASLGRLQTDYIDLSQVFAAATFGLTGLDLLTTTGMRINELLQVSLLASVPSHTGGRGN